jgi:hypothetical protein
VGSNETWSERWNGGEEREGEKWGSEMMVIGMGESVMIMSITIHLIFCVDVSSLFSNVYVEKW